MNDTTFAAILFVIAIPLAVLVLQIRKASQRIAEEQAREQVQDVRELKILRDMEAKTNEITVKTLSILEIGEEFEFGSRHNLASGSYCAISLQYHQPYGFAKIVRPLGGGEYKAKRVL